MPTKKKPAAPRARAKNIDKKEAFAIVGEALQLIAYTVAHARNGIDKAEAAALMHKVAELTAKIQAAAAD